MNIRSFTAAIACAVLVVGAQAGAATQQQVADYIELNVIPGGVYTTETLWMTDTAHTGLPHPVPTVARLWEATAPDVDFPYPQTWAVMIDYEPKANWGHAADLVLVNDDLTEHTLIPDVEYPPTIVADGGFGLELPFDCVPLTPRGCPGVVRAFHPAPVEEVRGSDKDCLWAVLISGGINARNNNTRYATNLKSMYSKLRACGYPKDQIFTYYADGNLKLDLDNADGDNDDSTGSDVSGAASQANIRFAIALLCAFLDPDEDVLFIYTTNHGKKNGGLNLWDFNGNSKNDADEIYTPAEFAADTANCQVCRLFVIMDQCYSGQFTGVAADGNHAKTAIYTAASANEPSVCRQYMSHWEGMNPSTSTIGAMHGAVKTAMSAQQKSCSAGPNFCEPCDDNTDCPGGVCENDPTSTPQSGGAANGNVSLCLCWDPTPVTDCITDNTGGPTDWSEGVWTNNGGEIGRTFVGGKTTPPSPCYDTVTLPVPPNDWHWTVTFLCGNTQVEIAVSVVGINPGDQVVVPLVCAEPLPILDLFVDLSDDTYVLTDEFGIPIFIGQWSQYPGDLLSAGLGFQPIEAGRVSLPPPFPPPCPPDLDGNGVVNVFDLFILLNTWGSCGIVCPADLNQDGVVNVFDLFILLQLWGPCPPLPVGACCLTDGGCVEVDAQVCQALGGDYLGDGTVCLGDDDNNGVDDACQLPPLQGCCLPSGVCIDAPPTECAAAGGTSGGPGSSCAGDTDGDGVDDTCIPLLPPGACCFSDGTCEVLTQQQCQAQGGLFVGPDTACLGDFDGNGIDDACDGGVGLQACCLPGGYCIDVKPQDCTTLGGVAQGLGTSCVTTTCGAAEACCFPDGSCAELLPSDCQAAGGIPGGPGTTCVDVDCSTGAEACCFPDGNCAELLPGDCQAAGGIPGGPGTTCADVNCTGLEACCFPDGGCADLLPNDCQAAGGIPGGPGTTCADVDCTAGLEACCFPDGTCALLNFADCKANGGIPQGPGTDCATVNCGQHPACPGTGDCAQPNPTPGCSDEQCCNVVCAIDPFCCDDHWDEFCVQEAVQLCQPQACCLPDGSCQFIIPSECAAQGGNPQGPGTDCQSVTCP